MKGAAPRRPHRAALLVAAAVALGVVGLGAYAAAVALRSRGEPGVVVEGGAFEEGAAFEEGSGAPAGRAGAATMRFKDGSEVALAAGARGKLAGVTDRGARVVLTEGEARVKVAHRPDGEWVIDAGPFSIRVTGTVLDVGWSSAEEALTVRVLEGSVTVRGPLGPGAVALAAGQRLTARAREGSFEVRAVEAEGEVGAEAEARELGAGH